MAYKYSVVSFLPDITAGEHVNIGIELHDMDTRVLYRKYTRNIKEINRRYSFGHKGVQKMHEIFFSGIIKSPDIEQDVDYLVKEHGRDRGIYNRIFFSDVRGGIKHTDKPEKMEDILEHLYDMFVVIDKKDDK